MTSEQLAKLTEIRRLMAEAYMDYLKRSDGTFKSGEGATKIHYAAYFPGYFDASGDVEADGLSIYSYALGPCLYHSWTFGDGPTNASDKFTGDQDPFDVALDDVRQWHAKQFATVYELGS